MIDLCSEDEVEEQMTSTRLRPYTIEEDRKIIRYIIDRRATLTANNFQAPHGFWNNLQMAVSNLRTNTSIRKRTFDLRKKSSKYLVEQYKISYGEAKFFQKLFPH